jgi:UPF0755 protein
MIMNIVSFGTRNVVKAKEQGLTPIGTILVYSAQRISKKKTKDRGLRGLLEPLKVGNGTSSRSYGNLCYKKEANDFEQIIKRVLYNDLTMVSPYNTYI